RNGLDNLEEAVKISIIVPVYNVEAYVEKCLQSISVQSIQAIEILVVNDGSTDKSGEICDAYAKKDARLKVVHEAKRGVSAARNTGVRHAVGEYIGFVDGDDYIEEKMYEQLYTNCIETGSDIAICTLGREINEELVQKKEPIFTRMFSTEEALEQLFTGK